jgi:hypothetical protein
MKTTVNVAHLCNTLPKKGIGSAISAKKGYICGDMVRTLTPMDVNVNKKTGHLFIFLSVEQNPNEAFQTLG